MKNMKKLLLIMLSLMTAFSLTGCGCTKGKNNNGTNNGKNGKAVETENDNNGSVTFADQTVKGLTFEHFAITKDSAEVSVLFFDITNNTEKDIYVGKVKYTLYDDGTEILSLTEPINATIKAGQSKSVIENYDVDLTRVDEVKYAVE